MANFAYNEGSLRTFDRNMAGTIDLANLSIALKWMLVTSAYNPDPDHVAVSLASGAEISVTASGGFGGYTPGFGQSGRRAMGGTSTTRKWVKDLAANKVALLSPVPVWANLNTGVKVKGAILILEVAPDDTTSILLYYLESISTDPDGIPTNGANFTVDIPASGLLIFG